MSTDLAAAFAGFYRGRHRPEDAYHWLTRPDEPGPSGARPTQHLFLQAADELERTGAGEASSALLRALADLLQTDRRHALDAIEEARTFLICQQDG